MKQQTIIRDGFISKGNAQITGSLTVNDSGLVLNTTLRTLNNDSGVSVDWKNAQLLKGGSVSIDWNGYTLHDGAGDASVDYRNRYLIDLSHITSVDWGDQKTLFDAYASSSLLWGGRQLVKSDGTTVTLDWETGALQGTASYATQALTASYALSSAGGGSGTVNSGNSSKLAYYASTGTAVSEAGKLEYDGSNLKLTSTSQLDFYTNAGSIYFGNFSSPTYGRVGFSVPGAAVMVIDYANVRAGFGGGTSLITSAPAALVEIQGKADEIQLLVRANGTQNQYVMVARDNANTDILTLDNSGVFWTSGGGTSDRRKKDNIMYLSYNHSNTINALKPAKFEFKNDPGVTRHGFIAQDVLEVKPELVLGNGDQEDGTYGLDYDGILAITVKSLQEALARISQLEQTVEELKKQ